ncbi:MAG: hypothetical protein E7310_06645 [Clostridiales bacterium]|nr:hypothetical protein [Clostridiales bacterium]
MKKRLLIIGITIVMLLISLTGCMNIEPTRNLETKETKSVVENTKWIASDGSEMIFGKKELRWYQKEGYYDDNYYFGKYEFYIGDDAVQFITTDLRSYGVTETELEELFERSDEYNRDNFVVFNIEYDGLKLNGETTKPTVSLVPWFGFILEDNKYLDVANMNTGTYYDFTKK